MSLKAGGSVGGKGKVSGSFNFSFFFTFFFIIIFFFFFVGGGFI